MKILPDTSISGQNLGIQYIARRISEEFSPRVISLIIFYYDMLGDYHKSIAGGTSSLVYFGGGEDLSMIQSLAQVEFVLQLSLF